MRRAAPLAGLALALTACGDDAPTQPQPAAPEVTHADVVDVRVSGQPGAYRLAVTLRSPDTGCERYADWWEVVEPDGDLIYRRLLAHPHVDEQPFQRNGGPIEIQPDDLIVVRAHLHPDGYGGRMFHGTVEHGLTVWDHAPDGFAVALERAEPQPKPCRP